MRQPANTAGLLRFPCARKRCQKIWPDRSLSGQGAGRPCPPRPARSAPPRRSPPQHPPSAPAGAGAPAGMVPSSPLKVSCLQTAARQPRGRGGSEGGAIAGAIARAAKGDSLCLAQVCLRESRRSPADSQPTCAYRCMQASPNPGGSGRPEADSSQCNDGAIFAPHALPAAAAGVRALPARQRCVAILKLRLEGQQHLGVGGVAGRCSQGQQCGDYKGRRSQCRPPYGLRR